MSSKLDHICTDIETLSTRPNAAIVSIAAVKFSLTSPETENFIIHIDARSSIKLGMHVEQSTMDWWKNNKEAAKSWMHSKIDIRNAINQYIEFVGTDKNTRHWANGINFDFPILESTMIELQIPTPWKYWNLSDMRTAYYLGGLHTLSEKRTGTYHNAIDDCLTQIAWLKKALGINHERTV